MIDMTLEKLIFERDRARKNHKNFKGRVINSVIAAVRLAAINEGCRDNIPETLVDKIIIKEQKVAKEMFDTCPKDREEMRKEYAERMLVMDAIAPKLIDDPEAITNKILELTKDIDFSQKGAVLKATMPYFSGKAELSVVRMCLDKLFTEKAGGKNG